MVVFSPSLLTTDELSPDSRLQAPIPFSKEYQIRPSATFTDTVFVNSPVEAVIVALPLSMEWTVSTPSSSTEATLELSLLQLINSTVAFEGVKATDFFKSYTSPYPSCPRYSFASFVNSKFSICITGFIFTVKVVETGDAAVTFIVAVPAFTPVTTPESSTVAISGFKLSHL